MLWRRKQAGEELDAELAFHLEQQIAENRAAGMDEREAREAALRLFGNPAALRDQVRDTWTWSAWEEFWRDVRQSLRALRRTPGFAVVSILVLALGIGANVALFALVRGVLLKPYPFPEANRLVRIYEADAQGRFQDNVVAGGDFADWKAQAKSFSGLAAKKPVRYGLSGTQGQLPEVVDAQQASWNLFPLLGVKPAVGRLFTASDDRRDAEATVILTWGLWKRRFGGNPAVIGSTVLLEARPYTVIGVLPAWFTYPNPQTQLWTAIYHERSPEVMSLHDAHNLNVVGRLFPSATLGQAQSEIAGIQAGIRRQYPAGAVMDSANIRPLVDSETHTVKVGLYTLFAATGCLLLIACLNIANLLVARAATRQKEAAIRAALGGSRWRLVRGQLIESLLLAVAGGALGLILAWAALKWLAMARPDVPRLETVHLDAWAWLFALGAVAVCGGMAGLIAASSSGDARILETLQESARSQGGSRGKVRLRRVLLALEVGLTVVLLIGAGLLLETYQHLRSIPLGYDANRLLTMTIRLPRGSYHDASSIVNFDDALLMRVRQLPGVRGAGLTNTLPGHGRDEDDDYVVKEHPPLPQGQTLDSSTIFVDPGYFAAMKIPLLQGEIFSDANRLDHANDILISQQLARDVFPNEDPIGKHIVTPYVFGADRPMRIVGVVGDIYLSPIEPLYPAIYYPLLSGDQRDASLVVRTAGDPAMLATSVEKAVSGIDRSLPVADVLTMDQVLDGALSEQSLNTLLLSGFGALSLLLAAVGLFGVLSYVVAQRTTEIGIRMALGAQRGQLVRQFLADGLRPAIWGLILGLAASAGVTQLMSTMLYGTRPLEPGVYLLVALGLIAVAAGACLAPAWRASQLDPIEALRRE
ncbi:ABC transporter permease [Silvibacterium dinghuense]|uniref:ABC transporter permease n=1 Tax=Silvibacterium dinghuense TaxID=1560006 RepID=A0A4Q1SKH0_9BACT|nr:ABC transporter permease [Silvibacterium dinghuense]RXS97790.1 ABC transporter permease [Silvibacterium dinghuense]